MELFRETPTGETSNLTSSRKAATKSRKSYEMSELDPVTSTPVPQVCPGQKSRTIF